MMTTENVGATRPDPSEADPSAAGRRRASTVEQVPEPDSLPVAHPHPVRTPRPIDNEVTRAATPAPAPAKKVAAKKAAASEDDG